MKMRIKYFDNATKLQKIEKGNWIDVYANKDVFEWVKGLIAMRKSHPAFRMSRADDVRKALRFHEHSNGLISFTLDGTISKDSWKKIFIAFNGTAQPKKPEIPTGKWRIFATNNALSKGRLTLSPTLAPYSALILFER